MRGMDPARIRIDIGATNYELANSAKRMVSPSISKTMTFGEVTPYMVDGKDTCI